MLEEPEAAEAASSQAAADGIPAGRLARMVARLANVRLLPQHQGEPSAIVIGAGVAHGRKSPPWLAVGDRNQQLAALKAGAAGAIGPDVAGPALAAALEAVKHGHAVLPPDLVGTLLRERLQDRDDQAVTRLPNVLGPVLTPREASVLQLLSEGATNKMIARRLEISVHTAKFHVASILDKLDATTRTDAVAQGVRQGLLML